MAFKVTYTNGTGKTRDVITNIKDGDRAREHQQAYSKRLPTGATESFSVEKGGKR